VKRRMKRTAWLAVAVMGLSGAALACTLGGRGDQSATAQALLETLKQTATAISTVVAETAAGTSLPPDLGGAVQTAQVLATEGRQGVEATLAAVGTQQAAMQAATAAAAVPILAELPLYGVDPGQGRVGWIHPPVTLDIQGFMQYAYENQFIITVARDFVVSADITWNTTTGLSGCGFVLRSNGEEEALDQYLAIATRGANGHVIFATMIDGDLIEEATQDMYARGTDPLFTSANDTTNRLTVVGRGSTFTFFTNGTQIGQVTAAEFEKGFIALVGLSESGRAICQFQNAWLWLIN